MKLFIYFIWFILQYYNNIYCFNVFLLFYSIIFI